MSKRPLLLAVVAGLALGWPGCRSLAPREPEREPPRSQESPQGEPLPVKKVDFDIVVAAWAEPPRLPPGGGDAQILVRVQKRGAIPAAGVEIRLASSEGSLFSGGNVLITDARGMTRDRLSTRTTATVTLNAGGTRYSFRVAVAPKPD